jgi:AcrR family transcriptional regulator
MVLSVKANLGKTPSSGPADDASPEKWRATDRSDAVTRVLDAAEELFYSRGIQSVGIDDIRDRSGVALKRLYECFSSKEALVVAVLERRDEFWRARLSAYVSEVEGPQDRILAVFDWLAEWFAEPGFRGCAWINSNGELGAVSPAVADQAKRHKAAFKRYLARLVAEADLEAGLTDTLALLAEGAMADAGIFETPSSASHARAAAETLIRAARRKPSRPRARRRGQQPD